MKPIGPKACSTVTVRRRPSATQHKVDGATLGGRGTGNAQGFAKRGKDCGVDAAVGAYHGEPARGLPLYVLPNR